MGLITADEARTWLKMPAGSDADPIIALLVESVSADCEAFVGGPVAQVARDEYLTGDGTSVMFLPATPVLTLTSLAIEGGAALVAGYDKDYVLVKRTGLVRLTSGVFPARPGSVHAVWTAGYAAVPADLKVSVMKGVAFNVHAQDKRRQGLTSYSTPDQAASYIEGEYPADVLDVWKRYRDGKVLVA